MESAIVIDLTTSGVDKNILGLLRNDGLRPRVLRRTQDTLTEFGLIVAPIVAIFVFDHMSTSALALLRESKRRFPSIPILMVTEAHSEELAIWAFRVGVWDYFYTPIDERHLRQVISVLKGLRTASPRQRTGPRRSLRLSGGIPQECKTVGEASSNRALNTAIAYVGKNYHQKIAQKEIAAACGLATFQFSRLFREQFGVTFQEYLVTVRINHARGFLKNPHMSVTEACFNCGFNDPSYFARAFSKIVGVTPRDYKNRHASEETSRPNAPAHRVNAHASPRAEPDSISGTSEFRLVYENGNP